MAHKIHVKVFSGAIETFPDHSYRIGEAGQLTIHRPHADETSGYLGSPVKIYAARNWSTIEIESDD